MSWLPLCCLLNLTNSVRDVIWKLICWQYLGRPERSFRKALCFTADVSFFLSPGYLRAPSADRRLTLQRDRNEGVLYNASPNIRGALPSKKRPKHAKFGAISDKVRLRSRISPERVKISKIGNRCDHRRLLLRSKKKVR